jgi:hypothetical protein
MELMGLHLPYVPERLNGDPLPIVEDSDDSPAGAGEPGTLRQAFIDDMIPHHQSAIEMAQVAREKGRNSQIKELAENSISARYRNRFVYTSERPYG